MSDAQVMRAAAAILAACGLNYGSGAPVVGVSPATLRHALLTQKLPGRHSPRSAILRFVELNGAARTRSDLRFAELI
jgi:hypothetical protein